MARPLHPFELLLLRSKPVWCLSPNLLMVNTFASELSLQQDSPTGAHSWQSPYVSAVGLPFCVAHYFLSGFLHQTTTRSSPTHSYFYGFDYSGCAASFRWFFYLLFFLFIKCITYGIFGNDAAIDQTLAPYLLAAELWKV